MYFDHISYHYVSAPAGSGKTHAAVRFAVDRARLGEKVIIAQPSKRCIAEWFGATTDYVDGLPGADVPVFRFDGDVCEEGQIVRSIAAHLEAPVDRGEVVFITHAALIRIADHHCVGRWHLIVDEIPAPDALFTKHLPNNHWFLTEAVFTEDHSADCVRMLPADEERLKGFAMNKSRDDIDAQFQSIAGCLISPHHDVFAIRENLQRTLTGETGAGQYPLYMFALLKPTIFQGFASVVIMGACFEESLLAILWGSQGVTFQPHANLTSRLRFTEHPNGVRLEIRYLTDDSWSKRLAGKAKKLNGREVTNNDLALQAVREVFGDEPFLYLVNKDADDAARAVFLETQAEPLPHTPHGLNCFDHYDNLAAIASFLPPPFHHRFLATQNLTSDAIRDAVHHQAVYQAVCRSSLRDVASLNSVKVLVTDKRIAEWLADQFPGCSLAPIGNAPLIRRGQPGRKRKHADSKARVDAYRQRRRDHQEEIKLAQMIPDIQDGSVSVTRNPKNFYSEIVTATSSHPAASGSDEEWFADLSFLREELWVGTLFRHRRDKQTDCHATAVSHDQIVDWLRHLHGLRYADKHENWLISPALFNPTLGGTSRGTDNVILAWGIWLDVDGGDLPYPEFQRMFDGKRMVVFNTWSSQNDTRYRVLLPTAGYMMVDTYKELCEQIVETVKSNGYCSPRQKQRGSKKPCHGIDLGKTYAANMMYLPCQPGPSGKAFFQVYDGDPIDPALWLKHNTRPIETEARCFDGEDYDEPSRVRPSPNTTSTTEAKQLLDAAAARLVGTSKGNRNNSLFYAARTCFALVDSGLLTSTDVEHELGTTARRVGLDWSEIKSTLRSGRHHARKNPPHNARTSAA